MIGFVASPSTHGQTRELVDIVSGLRDESGIDAGAKKDFRLSTGRIPEPLVIHIARNQATP